MSNPLLSIIVGGGKTQMKKGDKEGDKAMHGGGGMSVKNALNQK